jgi:hypothetical protein
MKTVYGKRRARRDPASAIFVKRDEFCEMLVSFRKMVRADEPAYRGLLDLETGKRFLVEREELLGR